LRWGWVRGKRIAAEAAPTVWSLGRGGAAGNPGGIGAQ
jgi:hypothetical protein